MNEFESHTDSGKVLVRIVTAVLIWIQHCERRRRTFVDIRQMMVGDDNVESLVTCPDEWLVRANPAIDAAHQFFTIVLCPLQPCPLNNLAFLTPMRDVLPRD